MLAWIHDTTPTRGRMAPTDHFLMRMFLLRSINLAWFLAALSLMCAIVPRPLPEYDQLPYGTFLEKFDKVELLFAGSSNIRMINVDAFEEHAAEIGIPITTVNLGVDGMWPPEAGEFLKRVLRKKPPHLKWIVLDLRPWKARYLPLPQFRSRRQERMAERFQNSMADWTGATEREVWWHTPRLTFRMLLVGWRTGIERETMRAHLGNGFRRFSPNGLGLQMFRRAWAPSEMIRLAADYEKHEKAVNRFSIPRNEYLDFCARTMEHDSMWDRQLTRSYITELDDWLRGRGYSVIYLYPPLAEPGALSNLIDLERLLPGREIWSFSDAKQYPQLFDYENRLEQYHLNAAGNLVFARLLAERFRDYRNPPYAAPPSLATTSAGGGELLAFNPCIIRGIRLP